MPITLHARTAISRTLQTLEVFRNVDPNMPIGEAVAFLLMASNEEATLQEIADKGGFLLGSVSRYAQDLGEFDRRNEPGHGLINSTTDLMNRKKKIRALTGKGKKLISDLESIGNR